MGYEYILLRGVNDRSEHAQALARLLRGRLAHVNLIPFNPAPGLPFDRPDEAGVDAFRRELLAHDVDATVRCSRGVRIQAGRGQLPGIARGFRHRVAPDPHVPYSVGDGRGTAKEVGDRLP